MKWTESDFSDGPITGHDIINEFINERINNMLLTHENYHSLGANKIFMGASQFKTFKDCEARGLAEVNGEYVRPSSVSLLVGSYVDAHFSGTLDLFKAKNPEIFTQKGTLKSEYQQADAIIARIERDPLMMKYLSGEMQKIFTGTIAGVQFKCMVDSYHEGKCIVDLKIMKDFEGVWVDGFKLPFIEAWGYDYQAAIYQAVEKNHLPFIIAAATKEKSATDIELFSIPQEHIDKCLMDVIELVPRFDAIKQGKIAPTRCGKCDYCKETKVLTGALNYQEVL